MGDFNSRLAEYQKEKRLVNAQLRLMGLLHTILVLIMVGTLIITVLTLMTSPLAGAIFALATYSCYFGIRVCTHKQAVLTHQKRNLRYAFSSGK